ncbi:hypothetical protein N9L68_06815 [bacterium]|nr:hypothetical protein [bacterium]
MVIVVFIIIIIMSIAVTGTGRQSSRKQASKQQSGNPASKGEARQAGGPAIWQSGKQTDGQSGQPIRQSENIKATTETLTY